MHSNLLFRTAPACYFFISLSCRNRRNNPPKSSTSKLIECQGTSHHIHHRLIPNVSSVWWVKRQWRHRSGTGCWQAGLKVLKRDVFRGVALVKPPYMAYWYVFFLAFIFDGLIIVGVMLGWWNCIIHTSQCTLLIAEGDLLCAGFLL